MILPVLAILLLSGPLPPESPCQFVDRSAPDSTKQALAPAIAKQLKLEKVVVQEIFKLKGWSIIHVGTFVSDDMFLFYKGDPAKQPYIAEWGGAAATHETEEIKAWVLENAKGIPENLAYCFAWHVTKGGE